VQNPNVPKVPVDPRYEETGFPTLQWEDEELPTRPLPLHELPLCVQVEHEMVVIAANHPRIALAIRTFWGKRDCVEYLQKLILSGGRSDGESRAGFKPEVVSALINLVGLHQLD